MVRAARESRSRIGSRARRKPACIHELAARSTSILTLGPLQTLTRTFGMRYQSNYNDNPRSSHRTLLEPLTFPTDSNANTQRPTSMGVKRVAYEPVVGETELDFASEHLFGSDNLIKSLRLFRSWMILSNASFDSASTTEGR